MADFNTMYQHGLYLSPGEQDLLLAALSSNNPNSKQQQYNTQKSNSATTVNNTPGQASSGSFNASPAFDGSNSQFGNFNYDESPFLDFNPDVEWDFQGSEDLIGDLPGGAQSDEHEVGDKRKESEDSTEEVTGKKRRESDDKGDDKTAKKPGRKPLTSEPTSRKAQNRAAQRAFRERKEKHLKDLETKVDELQKASDDANQENGLLKAQVERLQVELREYRKRLSWVTHGNALSAINSYPGNANRMSGLNNNDFMFDFPKFGDLPGGRIFSGKTQDKAKDDNPIPGVINRRSVPQAQPSNRTSTTASPKEATPGKSATTSPISTGLPSSHITNLSSFGFRQSGTGHLEGSTSDSPSSSSDSHQFLSSNGTSPEPSVQSPENKPHDSHEGHSCSIDAVRHRSESATNTPNQQANINNTFETPDNFPGLDFFAQQNVLSQEFNTFFDDAFPLPDLGSPSHNLTEAGAHAQQPKKSILDEIDSRMDDEVVPGEDKAQMLSCTKIWDRLQSMEKFRNGEIDVDNLCSELRTKARCSEGGVVVNQRDVDDIIGRS
ncbi:transcription factor PAP1-domain-containing protein [Aspergillus insuetus]